jgi:hypothetical protein
MGLTSRGVLPSSALGRILFCGVLFASTVARVGWAQAPQEIEATMKNMLAATQSKSLTDFVAAGDASLKSTMTQPMLDSFSAQFAPRLNQGYTTTFLARLNQAGYILYLWKLEFKDGGDDRLVTLVVKDGKVSGFYFR